jgi:uncharacterized protein YxjI
MGLRDRRENRRREKSEFGGGGSAATYQLRAKLVSFGDDYWIENAAGERVLRVDGKVLRVRKTLHIEDPQGTQLCRIQTRVMHIRDTMVIESPDGEEMAKVHKALITPLRERWKVDVADGTEMEVQGNILDHEYDLDVDGRKIAEVSKKWFRVRDTYGVQIAPAADTVLVLAVAVALDVMGHPGE